MTHSAIYKAFETLFPDTASARKVQVWFPTGKNCIRIRFEDGNEFIFTFNSSTDWRLESVKSYLNTIRKEANRRGRKDYA